MGCSALLDGCRALLILVTVAPACTVRTVRTGRHRLLSVATGAIGRIWPL